MLLDGRRLRLADSVVDVLKGTEAIYFAAINASGVELAIYIPHFSIRTVIINELGFLTRLLVPEILIASTLVAITLLVLVVALRFRRAKLVSRMIFTV